MAFGKGAFETGVYPNLFRQAGIRQKDIDGCVCSAFNQLLYGGEDERIYYPSDDDTAYILDTRNVDVRTEGMSYGMMFCVQMNRQEEFDRIWKWACKYMKHDSGKYRGYFAWSVKPDGTKNAQSPAPDGEEYFALALFFASHRWGDREAPFNYSGQARAILSECVHKGENGDMGSPMWNRENKLILFIPGSGFSDPSYHLPHFYELFALWADERDREFWREAAKASRRYLAASCHPVTGLAPEYANFDGTPVTADGNGCFYSDAYRVAGNIGLDSAWFGGSKDETAIVNRLQKFFYKEGISFGYCKYDIDGTHHLEEALHPYGLTAMNAMASLAATNLSTMEFVRSCWDLPLRTGPVRYYDACLQFFSLLALSGKYRIY